MKKKNKKAKIIIIKNNQLLMLKKKDSDFKFSLAGGNIKKNETKKEGLIREIKEELSVSINKSDLKYITGYTLHSLNSNDEHYYYYLKKEVENFTNGEPNKFERISWIDLDDAVLFLNKFERIILKDVLRAKLNV